MNDHVARSARLATDTPVIRFEAPDWSTEILAALLVVMGVGLLIALGKGLITVSERDNALRDARFWKSVATSQDGEPTVKLSPGPSGYTCRNFNIDPAWERAVQTECAVMARLLTMARPAP
jgi:hypothetical protein